MKRGEIWWHEPPDDNPHPALILTRDQAIDVLHWLLVLPITRTVRDIPTHVTLDQTDGMRQQCALTLDNTGPVAKEHLTRQITTLSPERTRAVCTALALATGCAAGGD